MKRMRYESGLGHTTMKMGIKSACLVLVRFKDRVRFSVINMLFMVYYAILYFILFILSFIS